MARLGRRWALVVALAATACPGQGEPPDCLDRRQEARNLALAGEVERAQAVLDGLAARCGPNSQSDIQHITKLIEARVAARRERERLDAERRAELEQFPSRGFVEWATERGGDVAGKVPSVICAERGTSLFGFCEGQRAGAAGMSVRYWQAQPDAYVYALVTDKLPSCQDLGEYRSVRAWRRDSSELELCELTNRRLRHLSALVVHAPPRHEMFIFSQQYPALDPSFERRLRVIEPK